MAQYLQLFNSTKIYPMKKASILLVIIILSISSFAQTQPTSSMGSYRNIFKVSAAMFTRNTFQMGYEHYFTPTTSFLLNAGMNFKENNYNNVQQWGVGAEAQVKVHVFTNIKSKTSHRLYFAPYLMNNYEEQQRNQYDYLGNYIKNNDSYDALGIGVVFGWSFSFANRINLDIYTGGGIRKAFNVDQSNDYYYNSSSIYDYSYSGIAPRLGIDVGFWF
jgi:hypothetical protein